MKEEKKEIIRTSVFPLILLIFLWLVKIIETHWKIDFSEFGIYPLKAKGLIGIIAAPLIHADFDHLISNSFPLFFLTWALFYFYKEIAWLIFALLYILPGIWVWLSAREAYHIGASGLIYGLVSFLFFSGLIRFNKNLLAFTLLITFLYGGLIWGIFPELFPGKNISFESHLWGGVAGFILAIYYRKKGPQKEVYHWDEDEPETDETQSDINNSPETNTTKDV